MGMFSSLFGSSGSDKADKMRQHAIDAFNAIKTPDLSQLQVQLDKEVSAGTLTPEQAEAQLLHSNAFNNIATDPSLTGAAKQALTQLQNIGAQGGMSAIDKARMQDITNETNQLAKSRNASIMSNAKERGIGGSGLELANTLSNEQDAANRASNAGTQVAADAEQRALQAIQAAGGLGQSMQAQEYGQQANKAAAQNAIDLFNANTANATNLYNVGTANQAQAQNLANAQNIANTNTGIGNQNTLYNAAQNQQVFNNEMGKAAGIAGTYNQWAADAQKQKQNEQGADMALLGGALKAGGTGLATAFGGPAGGMVASGAMDIGSGRTTNKNYDEDMLPGYSDGGMIDSNKNKGMSLDQAEPENKYSTEQFHKFLNNPEPSAPIYPPLNANISLSHSEAEPENKSLEDAYNDFVKNYCYGGTVKMADGGMVTIKAANKEPLHTTPPHSEGYAEGGEVKEENKSQPQPEPTQTPVTAHSDDDINWTQKLVSLLGSHADVANDIDKNQGGMIQDFRSGGKVPGVPKVHGDSPKNDVVPAKLSPGEMVLPRTVVNHPAAIPNFVHKTLTEEEPTAIALRRLRQAHTNRGA